MTQLKELATKPQLVKVTLDDADTIKEYPEGLEFFVWDKQPLEDFIQIATSTQNAENYPDMVKLCATMVLDDAGQPVMQDGLVLPGGIMLKCVNKVVEQLGK
jgi:hypothetical protein|tara:strand:- start:2920 stop:3225 length:306 start_codon:yes stop_codon:yes gene_type:complete